MFVGATPLGDLVRVVGLVDRFLAAKPGRERLHALRSHLTRGDRQDRGVDPTREGDRNRDVLGLPSPYIGSM